MEKFISFLRAKWKTLLGIALALLLVLVLLFFASAPAMIERSMNKTLPHAPYVVSDEARALHETLFVADLHADSLLWNRDLLRRSRQGHVDIPRLLEGNVALQVFDAVTKTPRDQNYDHNTGDTDNILLLAIVQRWPISTWTSLKDRALYQAANLHGLATLSGGQLVVVQSAADLKTFEDQRAENRMHVAGLLGLEGGHCLEGNVDSLDELFAVGYRILGLTHFFDNDLASSAHGVAKTGLTDFGKEVMKRAEMLEMIIDLAHAAPAVIDDVLAITTRPVLVSHTGVQGTCPGPRNLSDAHIEGIARTGGLIGIGYWDGAVCEPAVENVAKAIRYTADLVGVNHVALGSDYDGATSMAWDTSELVVVTEGLLQADFSDDEIHKIMGGNALRVFKEALPKKENAE